MSERVRERERERQGGWGVGEVNRKATTTVAEVRGEVGREGG